MIGFCDVGLFWCLFVLFLGYVFVCFVVGLYLCFFFFALLF